MVGSPWCWSENVDGCFEREGLEPLHTIVCMKSTPGDGGKYGW